MGLGPASPSPILQREDTRWRLEWVDRSLGEQPRFPAAVRLKVALCGHLDRPDEARRWWERMLELQPGLTVAGFQASLETFLSPEITAAYIEGLRKSGLPEE
jgi:hypothetical protein